jgi:outer membrane protein TolC
LIQYETVVLSALEEVENALVAYASEQVRRQSLLEASQAAQRAAKLSRDRYAAGLIDFQVVLDAERSLLSLQNQMAESDGKVTSNLIVLYKALGGGWTSLTAHDKT